MSRSLASFAARGLTVAVASRVLLSDIDLTVGPGTRLGLTGPNGSGKSTLLRVIAGLHPPDRGSVRLMPGDATVGYLPQETVARPGETVTQMLARRTGVAAAQQELDAATAALAEPRETAGATDANERYARALDRWLALGAADLEVRAEVVAGHLGLPPSTLHRDLTQLSGGQRARVQLAALLLARFDVFLLDEPTNDLDLAGLDRLERFVAGLAGPVVLVSHDRAFLERTVTAVAEIDAQAQTLTRYDGGWQAFVDERRRARERAEEEYRTYMGERDRLRDQARRQREWSARGVRTARRSDESDKFIRYGHTQGAQNSGARAAQTERALARLTPVDKPWEGWDLRMEIADAGRSGAVVVRLQDAVVQRPGFRLGPVTLEIGWGDRVALLGANGSGKTTLLGAMLGRLPLTAGTRWQGPGVVVGEIEQARHGFDAAPTLLDGFRGRTGVPNPAEARSLLAKFSLGADQVLRSPASLSPGERTRAALAVLQATGVNLLALDEPTNHLDLPAIEQLEQALGNFGGTLILVTHDRRLLDEVRCTRVFDVEDGQVQERR